MASRGSGRANGAGGRVSGGPGGRGRDGGGRGSGGRGRDGGSAGRGPAGRGGDSGGAASRGLGGRSGYLQPYGRGAAGGRGVGSGNYEQARAAGAGAGPVAVVTPAAFPTMPAAASSSSSSTAPPSSSTAAAAAVSALARDVNRRLTVTVPAPASAATAAGPSRSQPPEPQEPVLPAALPRSTNSLAPPSRPGFGKAGQKVIVRANHFLVRFADADVCHYDVTINPEPKARRLNRVVMSELTKLHRDSSLAGQLFAYDGGKSLYTAGELPFAAMDFSVKLGRPGRETEYKVTIRFAARANLYHLQEFLGARQRDSPQDTIQALDVVLRESPSLNYVAVARSFFSTTFGRRADIGDGLECWRGYYQSLRPTQMGLSLNIDTSSTSFYKPIPVIQFARECLDVRTVNPRWTLSERDRLKLKKALKGVRVETTHQEGKKSTYRITGLTSAPLNQLKFPMDNGVEMTVGKYFVDRYNYRLQFSSLPCLQSGSDSRPIYLPMEVCTIIEGQRFNRKLNEKQVTAMLRATCERPQKREQSIAEMVRHNNYADDKLVQAFKIDISTQMAIVPARLLSPPRLKYHDSGREKTCEPSAGHWNMINKKMVQGAVVQTWTCLNFSSMPVDGMRRFCADLVHMCNAIGMVITQPPVTEIRSASPNNIEVALKDVRERAPKLQLLIVILPDVTGHYGKIKKVCEIDLGIVSQCLRPRNVDKANKQFLENVALKINAKAGGRNTVLEDAVSRSIPLITDKPTIIFGADVTHPAPGEDSSSSIAAVVASMDWPEITKYRAVIAAQQHRQEIIQDLFWTRKDEKGNIVHGGMIRELLIAFHSKTGEKPERIIFYRDGVSEGQFAAVLLNEMDAIRKACASLDERYSPKVTFIVVQKRHHTRFFPHVHGKGTDKSGNIVAGTVVDTTICHPSEFDFYLCSHAGIQGTSKPVHYHVLFDENEFSADLLQLFTYRLCYTYARCTRSVSVVPPVYYADLVATRARYYDDEAPSGSDHGAPPQFRQLPQIKDNVKDVMFFC